MAISGKNVCLSTPNPINMKYDKMCIYFVSLLPSSCHLHGYFVVHLVSFHKEIFPIPLNEALLVTKQFYKYFT